MRSPVRAPGPEVQARPAGPSTLRRAQGRTLTPTVTSTGEPGGPTFLLDPGGILNLQRLSGNASVGVLLERAPVRPTSVQRCGDHRCAGDCPHASEEALTDTGSSSLQRQAVAAPLTPVTLTSPQFAGDARLEEATTNAPPLKRGEKSDAVAKMQRALMDDGFAMSITSRAAGPDGDFGAETERIVKAFQHKHGLSVDGQAGHDTLAKLDELNVARTAGAPAPKGPAPVTGFEVRGKRREKTPIPGKILFVENKADIEADQVTKLDVLAKPIDRPLTLNGFASEDEASPASLVDARLKAVAEKLKNAGHLESTLTLAPKPTAGTGRLDYRSVRSVEVIPTGSKSSEPDCTGGADIDCGPTPNPFTTGQQKALQMLDKAIGALHVPLDPDTAALLTRLFGGPAHMGALRNNLVKIREHVAHMPDKGRHRCHNACDGACSGSIAYNVDVGSKSVMTLCPIYLGTADVNDRAGTLVHEGSHGTAGLETDDLAYQFERVINFLSPTDALKNADSYTLYVQNLDKPGSVDIGPTEKDEFVGLANPDEEKAVERTVAFLERWLDSAFSEMSSLYDTINESRKKGRWTNTYYEASMAMVARRFGLTPPPALPTKADQEKVAGISDRYNRLFRRLGVKMTVEKVSSGMETWEPGPGTKITVTPLFFRLSKREQLDLLLTRLVQAFPEIIPAHQPGYVTLTDDVRKHFGTPAP